MKNDRYGLFAEIVALPLIILGLGYLIHLFSSFALGKGWEIAQASIADDNSLGFIWGFILGGVGALEYIIAMFLCFYFMPAMWLSFMKDLKKNWPLLI